jgi:ATP-binding cassette subfamily F protein 3
VLNVQNIIKSYNGNLVLDGVTFCANNGDKIAVVGLNGAGKSTLLNIISGKLEFNDGQVSDAQNIGFMQQTIDEMNLPENMSVSDFISTARPIKIIEDKINNAYMNGDLEQASDLEEELQKYSPYTAESEMHKLISNFGIPTDWMEKTVSSLSGGQKSKVAFARVLYSVYDLLLLDEPTNHLDKTTKDWAMGYIKSLSCPVVFISHDEEFLENIANKILYLDTQTRKTKLFNCDYKAFLKQKEDIAEALERQRYNQQKEINKLKTFVDNADNARKRQAISREKVLEKLEKNEIKITTEKRGIKLNLKPREIEHGNPVVVENVQFSYDPTKKIIKNTSFALANNERFLVVGHNGMGKSTLLKLLAGNLKPDQGKITLGNKTTIGYYAQEHENLNLENNALEEINAISKTMDESKKRGFLASFNFGKNDIFRQIKTFSPGERSRLSMAKLCLTGANLLLLDEPTNHLDIPTKKKIAETLNQYGGTMIIVSHDTKFLEYMDITRMFILPECKTKLYDENIVRLLENQA